MYRSFAIVLVCCLFGLACLYPIAVGQERGRKGFLSALREGQGIVLRETAGRYEISLMEGGHKVVEVGSDYVLVEDISGVTETRIPVYSIKNISRFKGLK